MLYDVSQANLATSGQEQQFEPNLFVILYSLFCIVCFTVSAFASETFVFVSAR